MKKLLCLSIMLSSLSCTARFVKGYRASVVPPAATQAPIPVVEPTIDPNNHEVRTGAYGVWFNTDSKEGKFGEFIMLRTKGFTCGRVSLMPRSDTSLTGPDKNAQLKIESYYWDEGIFDDEPHLSGSVRASVPLESRQTFWFDSAGVRTASHYRLYCTIYHSDTGTQEKVLCKDYVTITDPTEINDNCLGVENQYQDKLKLLSSISNR